MSPHLPDTLMLTLSSHLELGESRLPTLSWLIIGLINARTVNLSHVAGQLPTPRSSAQAIAVCSVFSSLCSWQGTGWLWLSSSSCRQAHEDQAALGLVPGSQQLENRAA